MYIRFLRPTRIESMLLKKKIFKKFVSFINLYITRGKRYSRIYTHPAAVRTIKRCNKNNKKKSLIKNASHILVCSLAVAMSASTQHLARTERRKSDKKKSEEVEEGRIRYKYMYNAGYKKRRAAQSLPRQFDFFFAYECSLICLYTYTSYI